MGRDRKRKKEEEELPHAFVFGAASLVAVFFALSQPGLWWLLFPAFGFGMGAAGAISNTMRKRRAAAPLAEGAPVPAQLPSTAPASVPAPPPPPVLPEDPSTAAISLRLSRVDNVCDVLLAGLKAAPTAARELVLGPEVTVDQLRKASHELARRERELRAAATTGDEARLKGEKAGLEARIAAEEDAVVRERLASAVEALDAQLTHRASLARSAARIEAEATRILYSLENLRAQVLRASAADSTAEDVAGDGLRESLVQLDREMDAVARALEEVHAPPAPRRPPQGQAVRG